VQQHQRESHATRRLLTDIEELADIVDDLTRLGDIVLVADNKHLLLRKDTQPVGQERVVHANAQPNLHEQHWPLPVYTVTPKNKMPLNSCQMHCFT